MSAVGAGRRGAVTENVGPVGRGHECRVLINFLNSLGFHLPNTRKLRKDGQPAGDVEKSDILGRAL